MVKCNILILHEILSNIVAILHNYVTLRIFDATLEQGPFSPYQKVCGGVVRDN